MRHFLIVVNPAAGKSNYHFKIDSISNFLSKEDFTYLIYFTVLENSTRHLKSYLQHNPTITDIIIVGGDGTINLCINALPHFEYAISIVNNGTGNDAIKNIYETKDLSQQLHTTIHGEIKKIDLGKCNDQLFINGVGMGFDGLVVRKMAKQKKKKKGLWAYFSTVLLILPKPQRHHLSLIIDNTKLKKEIFSITVTKGTTFGGGFIMNPNADHADGQLDICIFNRLTFIQKLLILPWVFIGKHGWSNRIEYLKSKSIIIESEVNIHGHIDGELLESNRFEFQVLPQKLKIRV